MNNTRRDKKNRLLKEGEYQNKDGKYEYHYVDINGKRSKVRSWCLVDTDSPPAGKKCNKSLRQLESEIQSYTSKQLDYKKSKITTVDDLYKIKMEQTLMFKMTTQKIYSTLYEFYIKPYLGNKNITNVKNSDIFKLYSHLVTSGCVRSKNKGLSLNTLTDIHKLIKIIFDIAIDDDLIFKNPTRGVLRKFVNNSNIKKPSKRHPLTIREEEIFINEVKTNDKYKYWETLFVVMLGTGCRIGEVCGLGWSDIDFKNNTITINHTLSYMQSLDKTRMEYHLTSPKTESGHREIPMLSEVRKALWKEKQRQMLEGHNNIEVGGKKDFIFVNTKGNLLNSVSINKVIKKVIKDYNKREEIESFNNLKSPEYLPDFSCHILRHTFCTRFCENETNLKVIQEIMGHSDISITMNVYNEATKDMKVESINNLEGKMVIG